MHRHIFAATTAATLLISSTVQAENVPLKSPEIERLLTDNTVEGVWDSKHYKSYFGADGVTIYAPENGEQQVGKWRVAPDTNQYESFFDAVGWTAYTVLSTDAGFAWMHGGETYPFAVIEGRALSE